MLITKAQLEAFTGRVFTESDEWSDLVDIFIGSAQAEIVNYLGFNPETDEDLQDYELLQIKNVCLEIAALIAMESDCNLGVNSSSETGGISRSFLNVVDFSRYLAKLSSYVRKRGF
ncbi:hypothetical protein [Treponema sp.]|uniref:hypothetical protein n=1 Tax=Treponema sp. TaxID=166 RepID=UPI0025DD5037|nr:hypothetical protein [Treponema sp.]MCR5219205.1 hypothetical protein [Treponema sp.]